jgi:hypothetical protein
VTQRDIELLIYQSAIERTKEHAARLKSRGAYGEWWNALKTLVRMEARTKEMQQ